jgi:hypothetical protein
LAVASLKNASVSRNEQSAPEGPPLGGAGGGEVGHGAAGIEDHDHLIAVGKREEIGDAGFQRLEMDRIGVIRALKRRGKEKQREAKEEHARFFHD